MLKKINEGGVTSEDGFSIQIVGPEIMEYMHEGKIIQIDVAHEPTNRKIYIYASEVSELTENEKKQMINNIKTALKLLTGDFEVI